MTQSYYSVRLSMISSLLAAIIALACGSQPDNTAPLKAPAGSSDHGATVVTLDELVEFVADLDESHSASQGTTIRSSDRLTPFGEVVADANYGPVDYSDGGVLRASRTRLESIVPPCIPFPGSDIDPCMRRDYFDTFTPGIEKTVVIPDVVATIEQGFLSWTDRPYWATHFVVRAIAVPGSVRCGPMVPVTGHNYAYKSGDLESTSMRSLCYVDLAINEYLVGQGPARMTATTGINFQAFNYESECGDLCRADGAKEVRSTGIEGVEWIIYLSGPRRLGQGTWDIGGVFDVQRRHDHTVVVVHRYKGVILENSAPENRALNLSRLEQPLDDFARNVADAFAAFVELTGGRTGVVNDWDGNLPPKMATDASPNGFSDFLMRTQLIEGTPPSPPPVPGENDPNPDGLTVNDIIATRVAGGVAIPGGLEGTATPVSALGDEPTATATEEAEPTATATVEPTVTPEPAPTPEPEATPTPRPATKGDSEHPQESARVDDGSGAVRVHSATVYPNPAGCWCDHDDLSITHLD